MLYIFVVLILVSLINTMYCQKGIIWSKKKAMQKMTSCKRGNFLTPLIFLSFIYRMPWEQCYFAKTGKSPKQWEKSSFYRQFLSDRKTFGFKTKILLIFGKDFLCFQCLNITPWCHKGVKSV